MNRVDDTNCPKAATAFERTDPLNLPDRQMPGTTHLIEEFTMFGPLGRDTYLRYAPVLPNNPDYVIEQIEKKFGRMADPENSEPRARRAEFWDCYNRLLKELSQKNSFPVLEEVYTFFRRERPLAATELGESRCGLGLHLQEITEFCKTFYQSGDGSSRFPEILSNRQAALLAQVVAPLHDLLKYLAGPAAQVMPDHEILTGELVRRCFEGRVVLLNGVESKLSAEDVDFIASVTSDHENINKELGRTDWVNSADPKERAKALFFVADVLTGVIVERPAGSNEWQMDFTQLERRFVDLYFRHIDQVKGKVFPPRPEWGLKAIEDICNTLDRLVASGCKITGERPGVSARETLIKGALLAIDRALEADRIFKETTGEAELSARSKKFLSGDHISHIESVRAQFEAL